MRNNVTGKVKKKKEEDYKKEKENVRDVNNVRNHVRCVNDAREYDHMRDVTVVTRK